MDLDKAFKVKPADRVALKGLIKEIEREGPGGRHVVERTRGRRLAPTGTLPEIAVVELYQIDAEGEAWCRPLGDAEGSRKRCTQSLSPLTRW